MHNIYLALGANVGDKKTNIQKAIELLQKHVQHIVLAPIYETKPWGFENQENFLNTVVKGETNLEPQELLTFVKEIEQEIGRKKRFTNGPREIDIDIIFFDGREYSSDTLTIPHPHMNERDFVLAPLFDIAPEKLHPVLKKTVRQLLEELSKENRFVVKRVED